MTETFLLLLTLLSLAAWVFAFGLRHRAKKINAAQALALLFVLGLVGSLGQLARSIHLEPVGLIIIGVVRAIFLIVPLALVWQWLQDGKNGKS